MKRSMKKFMVTCAAATAIAAVASVSAMAADYSAENNSATYTVPTSDADTQMTVLVIPKDADGAVTDENIYYIDQDGTLSGTALLKGDSLADGTYLVKVGYYEGGTFKIAQEEFVVGEVTEKTTVKIGDANGSNSITAADGTAILKHVGEVAALEGSKFVAAARSNGNDTVTAADATAVLKYVAEMTVANVGEDYTY